MKSKIIATFFAFFTAFVCSLLITNSAEAAPPPGGYVHYSSYTVNHPSVNNYYYQDVNHVVDVNNHYYVKHNYYVRDNKYVVHDLGYEKQYISYSDTYQVHMYEDGRTSTQKVAQSPYVYTTSKSKNVYVADRPGGMGAMSHSAPSYNYSYEVQTQPTHNPTQYQTSHASSGSHHSYNNYTYANDASGQIYYLSTTAPGYDRPHIMLGK
jgi:hypothetical protein